MTEIQRKHGNWPQKGWNSKSHTVLTSVLIKVLLLFSPRAHGWKVFRSQTAMTEHRHRNEQNYIENPRDIGTLNKLIEGFVRNITINISHLLSEKSHSTFYGNYFPERNQPYNFKKNVSFSMKHSRHICPDLDRFLKNNKAYKHAAYKETLIWWPLLSLLAVTTELRESLKYTRPNGYGCVWQCSIGRKHCCTVT